MPYHVCGCDWSSSVCGPGPAKRANLGTRFRGMREIQCSRSVLVTRMACPSRAFSFQAAPTPTRGKGGKTKFHTVTLRYYVAQLYTRTCKFELFILKVGSILEALGSCEFRGLRHGEGQSGFPACLFLARWRPEEHPFDVVGASESWVLAL